jgi:hypothetical protein
LGRAFLTDVAVNHLHRGILGVEARIIGHEVLIGNPHVGHASDGPELAKPEASGSAVAGDLNRPQDFASFRRLAVAVGFDHPMLAGIIEFKDQALPNRLTDRMHFPPWYSKRVALPRGTIPPPP